MSHPVPLVRNSHIWERLPLRDALAFLEAEVLSLPSIESLIYMLRRCTKERNSAFALRLHAYIHSKDLEFHEILGNYLVSMLVEAGCIPIAHKVFDKLLLRNEYSWNALISGYVRVGKPSQALQMYEKMQEDYLYPSGYTFLALLKSSGILKDSDKGHQIHASISILGLLQPEHFVGSALVDMYAKCGLLEEAQDVFDKLPVQNNVSWNSLIAGYANSEQGDKALHCFEQMQLKDYAPDAITFTCSLKACGSIAAIEKGREIHAEVERKGLLESDPVLGNALVDLYARFGLLLKAQEVLNKLPVRSVVSWNALLTGYARHEQHKEALQCYDQMHLEGVSPNPVTFSCCLKVLGSIGATDRGIEVHAEIARRGLLEKESVLGTALVDMYAKSGFLTTAQEVFDELSFRNVVTWNALIAGYVKHEHNEKALTCFKEMQLEGASPDCFTYACTLKACASIGAAGEGTEIHTEISSLGLLRKDPVLGSALVDMYTKCGLSARAMKVFDMLPSRDVVSWTALIAGFVEQDHYEEALTCFRRMSVEGVYPDSITYGCILKACGSIDAADKGSQIHTEVDKRGLLERDTLVGNALVEMYARCGLLMKAEEVFGKLASRDRAPWNALVAGYSKFERGEECLACFERMQSEGVVADAVTFSCILKACGSLGAIGKGTEIHVDIERRGLLEGDLVLGNSMIDMHAKFGLLAKAHDTFDELAIRDAVSWNALIAGYALAGESETVFSLLVQMERESLKPNLATCLSVLNACSHGGFVGKAQAYFKVMIEDYSIIPDIEHHTCMVDLLCRAGQVDRALAMVMEFPSHPDIVMWCTVLGNCRKLGYEELGRQAFDQATLLNENDTAAHVCLFNIYADALMQENMNRAEN